MKRQAPTERELTDMIAKAFERLPTPDPRRMVAIEQRLLTEASSRGRSKIAWWWLAGVLVASAATAMWWAVDYDSDDRREEPGPAVMSPMGAPASTNQPARPVQPEGAQSPPADEPGQKRRTVIFQREH